MSPPSVFLSYSHKDKRWKGYLEPHIQQFEKIGIIRYWDDTKIDGGEQWYRLLKEEMDAAAVAVCLISAKYLASNFCQKEEVPHLLERRQEHGLTIIPVLLDHCAWAEHRWLQRTQLLPGAEQPLSSFKGAGRSKQLQNVADCISRSISQKPVALLSEPSSIEKLDLRLPKTGAEVFGRDLELRILDDAWSDDAINLVALTGPGGVGKSALVNYWLARLAREGYRGARKVLGWSFTNQGSGQRFAGADEFIQFALAWFGDPDPDRGSPWDRGARLARLLRSDRALVVLDGVEALQSHSGDIRDPALNTFVLQSSGKYPGLCILTSRVTLGTSTTTNSKAIDLQLLSVEAGRALLRVNGVEGTDEALERAAKSFGRHALGVKLLSAYLACTNGGRVTDAVSIPDVEISDDESQQPGRVMAALASVLGSGPERELLDLVALFDRPADGAALRALRNHPAIPGLTEHLAVIDHAGWVSVVDRLRTLSLIAAEDPHEPDIIDAHPLVREYFGNALFNASPITWRAGHSRLYEYFLDLAPDLPSTLEEMVPLFQAIRHGCAAGRYEHAWREVFRRRIQRQWDFYGTRRLRAWGEHLASLVNFFDKRWSRPAAALDKRDRAFVLYQSGVCLRAVGNFTDATECLRAALDLSLSDADWAGAAVAASNLSETELLSGDLESAVLRGRQAVVFADQSGDPYQRSGKRTTLADALHQRGHLAEAEEMFAAAYRMTREDGTAEPMSQFGAYRWCELLLTRRRTQEAAQVTDLCLATRDSNPLYVALHQMVRGIALLRTSDAGNPSPEAIAAIEEAVRGLRQSGNADMTPRGLLARAELRMRQGAIDAALGDVDEATLLATRAQMPLLVVDARLVRASVFEAAGRIPEAQALVRQAHEDVARLGYGRRHADLDALRQRLTS